MATIKLIDIISLRCPCGLLCLQEELSREMLRLNRECSSGGGSRAIHVATWWVPGWRRWPGGLVLLAVCNVLNPRK